MNGAFGATNGHRTARPQLGLPDGHAPSNMLPLRVEVVLGVLLGWAIAASLVAVLRLVRPPRVVSSERIAMQQALHAATVTLPHLRRGLSEDSATKTIGPLRTLTQASAVALADREQLLAFDGDGADHHHRGDPLAGLLAGGRADRVHVESRIRCEHPGCPLGAAVLAPLVVGGESIGTFVALFARGRRLTPDETRTVAEAASLVSAQLELAELEAQSERLARAELRALRAQISPHFVYNALAAIAGYIHSNPEEARELLTEFAEFTRYAFRGQSPYVTLADELGYVEKYLRLERARFGDRLDVRLQVAPEVLAAAAPRRAAGRHRAASQFALSSAADRRFRRSSRASRNARVSACCRDLGLLWLHGRQRLLARGVIGRRRRQGPQHRPADRCRERSNEPAREERQVIAAGERGQVPVPGAEQRAGARGGEACEDRQAERAAHHERGVDDPRGEARLLRRDVAHGGEQHRIEADARRRPRAAPSPAARRRGTCRARARARTARARPPRAAVPTASGRWSPKRITSAPTGRARTPPMIRFAGRNASPTCSAL